MSAMKSTIDIVYSGNIRDEDISDFMTGSLRKFHNWIKMRLITDAQKTTQGTKLLDVAVGRGGDIFKWSNARFKYVTGFDSDSKSIYEKYNFDGAIKRYTTVKSEANMPKCFFWNISATNPNVLNLLNSKDRGNIYDVVSCQFSFHYFVNDIDIVLMKIYMHMYIYIYIYIETTLPDLT